MCYGEVFEFVICLMMGFFVTNFFVFVTKFVFFVTKFNLLLPNFGNKHTNFGNKSCLKLNIYLLELIKIW
jgi:hypothetical protein